MEKKKKSSLENINDNAKKISIKQKEDDKLFKNTKKMIKKYNLNFLNLWSEKNNFKFWSENFCEKLFNLSQNLELSEKSLIFNENGDIYFGKLKYGEKFGILN